MGRLKDEFKTAETTVFAISNEDAAALRKMRDAEKVDFIRFLSDRKGAAARQYAGVYENGILKPATFVIGRDGRITYAYIGEDYKVRPQAEAVLAAVRQAPR